MAARSARSERLEPQPSDVDQWKVSSRCARIRIRRSWSISCPASAPESGVVLPVREKVVRELCSLAAVAALAPGPRLSVFQLGHNPSWRGLRQGSALSPVAAVGRCCCCHRCCQPRPMLPGDAGFRRWRRGAWGTACPHVPAARGTGVSPGVLTPEFNRYGGGSPACPSWARSSGAWFRSASSWKLPHNYLHVAGDGPRLVAIIGC